MTPLTALYALFVGLLLGAAAALAESALRARRRPGRWVWALALLATASAPVWGPAIAARTASHDRAAHAELPVLAATPDPASPISATSWWTSAYERLTAVRTSLSRADGRLALAWALTSAAALGLVLLSLTRLHARVARLPRARVGGDEVHIAPDFGPACVGIARGRIVLPRWILGLDRDELDLVLRHERAHADAHDPLVLALGLALVAAAPWNPVLWWQVVRLRRAVELDCDGRVLASGAAPSTYGRVLVRVLTRVRTGPFPAPALLDPVSFLERRITLMRQSRPDSWTRSLGAGALALGLVMLACETPAPSPLAPAVPPSPAEVSPAPTEAPSVTLFDAVQVRSIGTLPENATVVIDGVIVRGESLRAVEIDPSRIRSVEVVRNSDAPVIRITTVDAPEADPAPPPTPAAAVRPHGTILLPADGARPIVFVDGVRIEGGVAAVQEQELEIESIEVVKGAAARLILGEEARHGVIRVTTKKPAG